MWTGLSNAIGVHQTLLTVLKTKLRRIGVLTRGPFYSPEGKKAPILDHIETLLDNGGWGAVRRLAMGQSEKCGVKKASGQVVGVVCLGTSFPRFVPMEYDKPGGKRICRCTGERTEGRLVLRALVEDLGFWFLLAHRECR